MCAFTHQAKPYQLALLIKKSLDDVTGTVKPLYDTSIKIFISPLSILYLQEVVLIHLKKCVFYIIYELKLPLRFSLRHSHPTLFSFGGSQPMISIDSYMSSSYMTRNTQAFGAPPYFVINLVPRDQRGYPRFVILLRGASNKIHSR